LFIFFTSVNEKDFVIENNLSKEFDKNLIIKLNCEEVCHVVLLSFIQIVKLLEKYEDRKDLIPSKSKSN